MRTGIGRLSIGRLLGFIALCAIGFAALASPSALWVAVVVTLNLALLVVGLIGALYHRDHDRRAFWGGFLAAGRVYLVASRVPWFGTTGLSENLVTTAVLDFLSAQVEPTGAVTVSGTLNGAIGMMGGGPSGMPTPPPPTRWAVWTEPERAVQHLTFGPTATWSAPVTFLRIGHSLFGILSGIMGGWLTWWFRSGGRAEDGRPIA